MHTNMDEIKQLDSVLSYVKGAFVGKDELVDLLGICLVAEEKCLHS